MTDITIGDLILHNDRQDQFRCPEAVSEALHRHLTQLLPTMRLQRLHGFDMSFSEEWLYPDEPSTLDSFGVKPSEAFTAMLYPIYGSDVADLHRQLCDLLASDPKHCALTVDRWKVTLYPDLMNRSNQHMELPVAIKPFLTVAA